MGGPEMFARTPMPQLNDAQRVSIKAALARINAA